MNKFFIRKEAKGKSAIDATKDIASKSWDIWKSLTDSGFTSAGVAAVLTSVAIANMIKPKAIADNADEYVFNETAKESLLKSIRDQQKLIAKQRAKELLKDNRLPHDQFV